MNPLYTRKELKKFKSDDVLPCKCYTCNNIFYLTKHRILMALNPNTKKTGEYCSKKCQSVGQITTKKTISCKQCNKQFSIKGFEFKKSNNHFCSKSCTATYNNTHKTHGTKRSKLEVYLEEQLTLLYPGLEIDYNQKTAINSELDIYIPSLNLAFELNGIYHYEPIHGDKKLNQIQNNDQNKFQACIEKNISLCIIDVSYIKYFKEKSSIVILNNILQIIRTHNRI